MIGDFGLAEYTNKDRYVYDRCGTPGYVAPEISNFKQGDKPTSKCDMFSIGGILHIVLHRSALFQGATVEEVYKKNRSMDFDLEDPKYNNVDGDGLNLLKRMLKKNPE